MLYTISIYHGICSPLKNPIDRSARSMPKRPRSNWTSARRPSTVPRMASLSARWRWVLRFFWRKHYDTTIKQYDNIWMLWMFVCFLGFPCIFWVEQIVCWLLLPCFSCQVVLIFGWIYVLLMLISSDRKNQLRTLAAPHCTRRAPLGEQLLYKSCKTVSHLGFVLIYIILHFKPIPVGFHVSFKRHLPVISCVLSSLGANKLLYEELRPERSLKSLGRPQTIGETP